MLISSGGRCCFHAASTACGGVIVSSLHTPCNRSLLFLVFALQIPPGPVSTWARSSASSAQGSIETWGLTCLVFDRWTWTIGPESSRKSWLPSETTWLTASGRPTRRVEPNPHLMQPGGYNPSTLFIRILTFNHLVSAHRLHLLCLFYK